MIAPELVEEVERQRHAAAVAAVDWDGYRKCTTCLRPSGRACKSRSGFVMGGQPDGVAVELEHAHVARKRRVGR